MISLVYTQEIKSKVLRQTTASYSSTFSELFFVDRRRLPMTDAQLGSRSGEPLKMQAGSAAPLDVQDVGYPAPSDVQPAPGVRH